MVSNLFTFCRAACPGSATSATESYPVSTQAGATSFKLSTRGYSITKSKIWKETNNANDENIYGIEFTYSTDCCGLPDIVHMYGSRTGSNVFSESISSKVIAVNFRYDTSKLRDIWFNLANGTTRKTTGCTSCMYGRTISLSATQSLSGLAIKEMLTT